MGQQIFLMEIQKMKFAVIVSCLLILSGCAGRSIMLNNSRIDTSETPNVKQRLPGQKKWEPIFFREINERIEGTGIKSLRDQEMSPHSQEVRVWVVFGLAPLRGVILRQTSGEWSAIEIPPLDKRSNTTKAVRPLSPPKSGWKALWEKLESLEIYTLPDAMDIGADNPYPEAMSAVVEIKTPTSYRTYKYGGLHPADKQEIKNVVKILITLSDEFGVPLY